MASSSPRRAEILTQMGVSFRSVAPGVDESPAPGLSPELVAVTLAREKSLAVREMESGASEWILSADTVVALDNEIMGKPRNADEARRFLSALSGTVHHVHTGVAVAVPGRDEDSILTAYATTRVEFADLSVSEIEWYLHTEEWRGVAGAYRIQGKGACLIESISGSYSNVVGLPIRLVYSMLTSNGFVA